MEPFPCHVPEEGGAAEAGASSIWANGAVQGEQLGSELTQTGGPCISLFSGSRSPGIWLQTSQVYACENSGILFFSPHACSSVCEKYLAYFTPLDVVAVYHGL